MLSLHEPSSGLLTLYQYHDIDSPITLERQRLMSIISFVWNLILCMEYILTDSEKSFVTFFFSFFFLVGITFQYQRTCLFIPRLVEDITVFKTHLMYRLPEIVLHMSRRKCSSSAFCQWTGHKGWLDHGQTALAQMSQVYILRSSCLGLKAVWSRRKILFLGSATMLTRNMLFRNQKPWRK